MKISLIACAALFLTLAGVVAAAQNELRAIDAPVVTLTQADEKTPETADSEVSDAGTEADSDAAASEADAIADEVDELLDVEPTESGVYDQDDDDDFVPTQEVSSDQSLKFPIDI